MSYHKTTNEDLSVPERTYDHGSVFFSATLSMFGFPCALNDLAIMLVIMSF